MGNTSEQKKTSSAFFSQHQNLPLCDPRPVATRTRLPHRLHLPVTRDDTRTRSLLSRLFVPKPHTKSWLVGSGCRRGQLISWDFGFNLKLVRQTILPFAIKCQPQFAPDHMGTADAAHSIVSGYLLFCAVKQCERLLGGDEFGPEGLEFRNRSGSHPRPSEFQSHPGPPKRAARARAIPWLRSRTQYSVTTPKTTNSASPSNRSSNSSACRL